MKNNSDVQEDSKPRPLNSPTSDANCNIASNINSSSSNININDNKDEKEVDASCLYSRDTSRETCLRIQQVMETTTYRDLSHVHRYEVTCEAASLKKQRSFPIVLHEILSRSDEFGAAICWLPHGRAWKILRDDLLVEKVLPNFFNHKSRASFLRQVNNWDFKRVLHGPDENAYYHEKFLRGMPHISFLMKQSQSERRKNPSAKKSDHFIVARMLDIPPDFYAITKAHPLPEACAFQPSSASTGFASASETTTTTSTAADYEGPNTGCSDYHHMGVKSGHATNRNNAEKRVSFSMAPLSQSRQNNYATAGCAPVAQNCGTNTNFSMGVGLSGNEAPENYQQQQSQYLQKQQQLQQQGFSQPHVNQELFQQASTFANQPTQQMANQSSNTVSYPMINNANYNLFTNFHGAPGTIPLANADGSENPLPSTGLGFNNSNTFMPQMTVFPGTITPSALSSPQLQQPALPPSLIQQQQVQYQQQGPQSSASSGQFQQQMQQQLQKQLSFQQMQMLLYQLGAQANFGQTAYPMDPTAVMLLQRMIINPNLCGFSPQVMQQIQGLQPNNSQASAPNLAVPSVQGGDAGGDGVDDGSSQDITNSNNSNETNGLPPLPPSKQ